jgi:hypothetical protein
MKMSLGMLSVSDAMQDGQGGQRAGSPHVKDGACPGSAKESLGAVSHKQEQS